MSLYQTPPETVLIDGVEYPIKTDFRKWIEFQGILTYGGNTSEKAVRLCEFMESQGLPQNESALHALVEFYVGESHENASAGWKKPAAFDFDQDSEYIYSAFLSAYQIDLSSAQLHWWTFRALFKSLPDDCEICKIMRYRTVPLKDVPKSQKQFYREMKSKYALNHSGTGYRTEQEMKDYVRKRYEEAKKQLNEAQR